MSYTVTFTHSKFPSSATSPAMAAVSRHATTPEMSARGATRRMSCRRWGTTVLRAVVIIPSATRSENPHRAYVASISDLGCNRGS